MIFTQDKIQKLLEVVDIPIMKYFIIIRIYTGMRLGEIFNLEWKDILMEERLIKILNKDDYTIKDRKNKDSSDFGQAVKRSNGNKAKLSRVC